MVRGTTPTLGFSIPCAPEEINAGYVTLAQFGRVKVEKALPDFLFDGGKLYVALTQKDTLSLTAGFKTEIQLSIRCDQMVLRSEIISVETERILKDGEI